MNIEEAEKLWYSEGYDKKYRAYDKVKTKEVSRILTDAGLSGKPRLIVIIKAIQELEKEE